MKFLESKALTNVLLILIIDHFHIFDPLKELATLVLFFIVIPGAAIYFLYVKREFLMKVLNKVKFFGTDPAVILVILIALVLITVIKLLS